MKQYVRIFWVLAGTVVLAGSVAAIAAGSQACGGGGGPRATEPPILSAAPSGTATVRLDEPLPATKTPEATPTPVIPESPPSREPASLPGYAIELGYKHTYGGVTFGVAKETQTRIDYYDVVVGARRTAIPIHEIYLNTEDVHDAEQKLIEGVDRSLYEAYIKGDFAQNVDNPLSLTFNQYLQETKDGVSHKLTIKALSGNSDEIKDMEVDLNKPVAIILIPDRTNFYILSNGLSINNRVMENGELYIEIFDKNWGYINPIDESLKSPNRWVPGGNLSTILTLLNIPAQKQFSRQRPYSITGEVVKIKADRKILDPYFQPINSTEEKKGILRVR